VTPDDAAVGAQAAPAAQSRRLLRAESDKSRSRVSAIFAIAYIDIDMIIRLQIARVLGL
jgi:hypothetical protein